MSTENVERKGGTRRPRKRRRGRDSKDNRRRSGSNRSRNTDNHYSSVRSPQRSSRMVALPPNYPFYNQPFESSLRLRNSDGTSPKSLKQQLQQLPEDYLKCLHQSFDGQLNQVESTEHLASLIHRALKKRDRVNNLVRDIHQRDRQALAVLLQCGGIAHHQEIINELLVSLGGNEAEWQRVLKTLGKKGIVARSDIKDEHFFYIIPSPVMNALVDTPIMKDEIRLPMHENSQFQGEEDDTFSPPLSFTLVAYSTYMDQQPLRLNQGGDIHRSSREDLQEFFKQIWDNEPDLIEFHNQFFMQHHLAQMRGDMMELNSSVMSEFVTLSQSDQFTLIIKLLEAEIPLTEWLLWVLYDAGEAWLSDQMLGPLYRRWIRGDNWRKRYHSGDWKTLEHQRDNFGFNLLINLQIIDVNHWGDTKFYRLTSRGRSLLDVENYEDDSFYLTSNFEITAPSNLPPKTIFHLGQLCEFVRCDRANLFRITQYSIERAINRGWRWEDVIDFLRVRSKYPIPENVEQTLREWMGHHGDIEFHEVTLITVHRAQIRRFESQRSLKPFILHRFVPGVYAIDITRREDLQDALNEAGFSPCEHINTYPANMDSIGQRSRIQELVNQGRSQRQDLIRIAQNADSSPESLFSLAAPKTKSRRKSKSNTVRKSLAAIASTCESAIRAGQNLKVNYLTKSDERKQFTLLPERLAFTPNNKQVLVATDKATGSKHSFFIERIERIQAVD
ncbi:MAG: helicase-associated domain-containing protein [Myxococcota bacterium]